jgi:hypothetical protein
MAYNNNGTNVSFSQGTYNPSNAYAQSTNPRGSMYLTNPTGPYPIVTNGPVYRSVPRGQKPDPNLDYSNIFNQGGNLRKHRKTKKAGRRHKSRKHHKKSSRRYYR